MKFNYDDHQKGATRQIIVSSEWDKAKSTAPFPDSLVLSPISRRPMRLPDDTVQTVLSTPVSDSLITKTDSSLKNRYRCASIIVVTYNNLVFTKLCLESLLANTDYPNYEVIIVDNGSHDGTVDYLRGVMKHQPHVHAIFNDRNLGFAPANNQGLAIARGDILVLLNNDTIVPPGWLMSLVKHLEDQSIGLLGPVTNRIGNEAEIEADYQTYGEFLQFARDYTRQHAGEFFNIRTLCMYCLAMRRDVYEHLGPLDEQYEIGMLEDDDYSMLAHAANYRVVCAEDVFVHHFGQASFGSLFASGEYAMLLETNRRRFEEKWGVKWQPYGRRLSSRYVQTYDRVREAIAEIVPAEANVLVVSKGDEELVRLNGVCAFHFPQNERGEYAGYHPADSATAIAHLEDLRIRGAEFLVFPQSAFWWLPHYAAFRQHLDTQHQCVWNDESSIIYRLSTDSCVESPVGKIQ